MSIKQINRLSISIFIFLAVIVISQLLLQIPALKYIFSAEIIYGIQGIWVWLVVWLLIMLECGVIPGSYLPILLFCLQTPMANSPWLLWIITTSAVFIGRVMAYFVGQKSAGLLLNWAAGKDYDSWCQKLSGKSGKLIYFITVIAPGFPDFVLALVAGSLKMNFWYYLATNVLCKGLENALLIFGNFYLQGFSKFIFVYLALMVISLITFIVTTIIKNKK